MIELLREWWQARDPRERRVVTVGAVALGIAAFWAYAWMPIETARARLAEALPRLRVAAQQLARDAAEVERLHSAVRARGAASSPQSAIAEAMAGLGQRSAGVTALADGRVQVNLQAVPFDALVEVLARLAEAHGLAVESIALRASGEAGTVRVESLVLRAGPKG